MLWWCGPAARVPHLLQSRAQSLNAFIYKVRLARGASPAWHGSRSSPSARPPEMFHENFAAEFRTVNRKRQDSCLNPSPYLSINVGVPPSDRRRRPQARRQRLGRYDHAVQLQVKFWITYRSPFPRQFMCVCFDGSPRIDACMHAQSLRMPSQRCELRGDR